MEATRGMVSITGSSFSPANIYTIRMILLTINHVLDCSFNIIQRIPDLLLGIVVPTLSLLDSLLLIALEGQFIVTQPQLFEALFTWIPSKELDGYFFLWPIGREDIERTILREIIYDLVFL